MSGKRQHFIPRFLQEGFKSHSEGGENYTWVYRKGKKPFNTNLINVGIEKYFYTDQSDSKADDKITEAEYAFSNLVRKLRRQNFGDVSESLIPEFIAHLEVRTRHLRQNFLEIGDILFKEVFSFLKDEEAFLSYAKKEIKNENSQLFKDAVTEFKINGYPESLAKRLIKLHPDQLINELKPYLSLAVFQMQNQVTKEDLEKEIKKSHINVLKQTIAPDKRVNFYKKLEYSLIEINNNALIQGDSVFLFKTSKTYKTFVDKTDKIEGILLPLEPNKLLLGKTQNLKLEPDQLSRLIASYSLEYFIASEKRSELENLREQIGKDAQILTRKEIESLVSETFSI